VYSAEVLDHFENPRNTGTLNCPTAAAQVENPACGDVLKLTARVVGGRIAEIKFLAQGCVSAIACGSAITELALGKTAGEAASIRREELVQTLGSLPETSNHASHLAMDALAALVKNMGLNGR
jgi:nitrogen fixation protein NifU and related proteins